MLHNILLKRIIQHWNKTVSVIRNTSYNNSGEYKHLKHQEFHFYFSISLAVPSIIMT